MMLTEAMSIRVYGVVQGVGFRPFIRNLADGAGLAGSVRNMGPYVEIYAEGGEPQLAAFLRDIKQKAPARAAVLRVEAIPAAKRGLACFTILESGHETGGGVYVSPDIGVCDDCARELFDKTDRRYLHPFINCTACGPRMTILDSMPYDRARTSMGRFELCPDCAAEYADPADRRYHAQPVCCPQCGPKLALLKGGDGDADPVAAVRAVLRRGGIAAVKGIGGFHLCCDATDAQAVARLRALKRRPAKPFAVMAKNVAAAGRECRLGGPERELLESPMKPILLLGRRAGGLVCGDCAPGSPRLGLMLPYAPVQLLLFGYPDGKSFPDCLVMTSGNRAGEPICIDDAGALKALSPLCDIILTHDREIRLRADDSVMAVHRGAGFLLRRSRGFAPLPVVPRPNGGPDILAVGGEMKNAFCLAAAGGYCMSPHVGELSAPGGARALDEAVCRMETLLGVKPAAVACDLHPGYNATAYAKSLGLPVIGVQHHFAHAAACMAENGLTGETIGVSLDGTGYGADGTVWGGEFLRVSYRGFQRLGSLAPFALQGGDLAVSQGWRPALSLLLGAFGDPERAEKTALELELCAPVEARAVLTALTRGVNCVQTTSAGRLFNAVAAILGIRRVSTFEGEAAMALEYRCADETASPLAAELSSGCAGGAFEIRTADVIQYIIGRRLAGGDVSALAAQFHAFAAEAVVQGCLRCRERTGLNRVALSGGCFQNLTLLSLCEKRLAAAGFAVFSHAQVPPNDGGIALGQAAVADALLRAGMVY